MTPLSLQEYLSREIGYDAERMDGTPDPALARLITGISEACKEISAPKFAKVLSPAYWVLPAVKMFRAKTKRNSTSSPTTFLWRLSLVPEASAAW